MTQLKHSYYFVRGHLDNDWIEGEFDTYEDGAKLINAQNYTSEYRNEMIGILQQLE